MQIRRSFWKMFLKEFLFIPILLLTLFLFMVKINVFKNSNILINYFCALFVSFFILIVLEAFLSFDIPKNLLFSRTIAIAFCLLSFYIFMRYTSEYLYPLIFTIISLYISQIVSYFLQKLVNFKKSSLVSVFLIVFIGVSLLYIEYFK